MICNVIFAALVAIPAVAAQTSAVTGTATRCTTRYGYAPLASGTAGVSTWYNYMTTSNTIRITVTSQDTVFVTPTATVFTDVLTTTVQVNMTTTSVPLATTIATPSGFIPLYIAYVPGPTAVGRFKRGALEYRDADVGLSLFKRQTSPKNVAGFAVGRNGNSTYLYNKYPHRVDCRVTYTVNTTETTVVDGPPVTSIADGTTATALSTTTVSSTSTITEVLPRETIYAACQDNNVVNHIYGFTGEQLYFDRVVYRPREGFPIENELIVNTTSAKNCCIACQNTPYCAGSFYVPKPKECHIRLTQAPAILPGYPAINPPYANTTRGIDGPTAYPTAYGTAYGTGYPTLYPTAASSGPLPPYPTSTATPNTCPNGSLSNYLGTIQGQEDFPEEYALSFSNGPCGRLSVWPIPVWDDVDTSLSDRRLRLH